MQDIQNIEDIKVFVDGFYGKIQTDELLAPIFGLRVKDGEWQPHLDKMYSFWNTVLFHQLDYKGAPFSKHVHLPIDARHFQQWLTLFKTTIDDNFAGEKAEEAKTRATKMATMFMHKLDFLRNNPNYRSIV